MTNFPFSVRLVVALLVGLATGAAIGWIAADTLQLGEVLGFWSVSYGTLGAVCFFGAALSVLGGAAVVVRVGRFLVAGAFAALALGGAFVVSRVGVPPPWTAEGAWLWPLGIGSFAAAGFAARWATHGHRR